MIDKSKDAILCDYCMDIIKIFNHKSDNFYDFVDCFGSTSDVVCVCNPYRMQAWNDTGIMGKVETHHGSSMNLHYHKKCFLLMAGKDFFKNCGKGH